MKRFKAKRVIGFAVFMLVLSGAVIPPDYTQSQAQTVSQVRY